MTVLKIIIYFQLTCSVGWCRIVPSYSNTKVRLLLEKDIREIPLEEYVLQVTTSEMPSQWPMEALKAQAVLARTYALYQKKWSKENFDVKATHLDQVYLPKNVSTALRRQIKSTQDLILVDPLRHQLIKPFFHSRCGGLTALPEEVWGNDSSSRWYVRVPCPYCHSFPFNWEKKFSKSELAKKLNLSTSFEIQSLDTIFHRVTRFMIHNGEQLVQRLSNDVRLQLGFDEIKSSRFSISYLPQHVLFQGTGYGHGVGLCQWGAYHLAKQGFGYQQILKYYYPKLEIIKAPSTRAHP